MTPVELFDIRLQRLAEDVQFRHYIVCKNCLGPIIVLEPVLDSPPSYMTCGDCGCLVPFEVERIRSYEPPTLP